MPSDTAKKYLEIYNKLKKYSDIYGTEATSKLINDLGIRPSTLKKVINFARALEIARKEYPLVYQKILLGKIKGGVSRLAENDDPEKIKKLLEEIASQTPEPAPHEDSPPEPKSKLKMILEKPEIIMMGIPSAEEIIKEYTRKEKEGEGGRWVLNYEKLYPQLGGIANQ